MPLNPVASQSERAKLKQAIKRIHDKSRPIHSPTPLTNGHDQKCGSHPRKIKKWKLEQVFKPIQEQLKPILN